MHILNFTSCVLYLAYRSDHEGLFAALSKGSQDIPLFTDLLTASIDAGRVIVFQFTGEQNKALIQINCSVEKHFVNHW